MRLQFEKLIADSRERALTSATAYEVDEHPREQFESLGYAQ